MDNIEELITRITTSISASSMSEDEKAEALSQLSVGMRRLVWPILLSHVPEYMLEDAVKKSTLTIEEYAEIIETAMSNPATPRQMHDELLGALKEVDTLLSERLKDPKSAPAPSVS